MRAAMETGIEIPKLCATDMLDAFGSCRICLVEIEGRAGTPASCTTPVAEGIVVNTQSERLSRLRKGVMELYVTDHSVDCLTAANIPTAICSIPPRKWASRRCATALTAKTPPQPRHRRFQSVFHFRSGEMHRLLTLRARLRGGRRALSH